MKRINVKIWKGIGSLMLVVAMPFGCVTIDQMSKQMPPVSQCMLNCTSGEVLASETTLGRCTLYVVDKMCVGTANPGGCEGDSKGYRVLIQNQSGAVVDVRNEALQKGKWGAHWGEKKVIKPYGSNEWGIATTHGTGVRFVCP
jgi:hypothetical protein